MSEPLGVGEVRCSRCQKVIGIVLNEEVDGTIQARVCLSDPLHGYSPPITCPEV